MLPTSLPLRRRFQIDPPAQRPFPKRRDHVLASQRWADGGSRDGLRLLAVTFDESVQAAQRVGLLEAAIGLDCRRKALVAEEKPDGLIFARMRGAERCRNAWALRTISVSWTIVYLVCSASCAGVLGPPLRAGNR